MVVKPTRVAFVSGLVALVLGISGIAFAKVTDEPDTWFTYGYDADNHVLVFGTSPADTEVCSLDGRVTAEYGMFEAGMAMVELMQGGMNVFDEACPLAAWLVAGPQGQINHGQVVRTFSHALEGWHKGCLMRWVAGSQFGKGEEQVRTPDADPEFVPEGMGELELMTQGAVCEHGNGNGAVQSQGANVGRGNSANAPGHNK